MNRTEEYLKLCLPIVAYFEKYGFPENMDSNDLTDHITMEIEGYRIDVRRSLKPLKTFDMLGRDFIVDTDIDKKRHNHKKNDPCHRCSSRNTEVNAYGKEESYWIILECLNCNFGCIFNGGS